MASPREQILHPPRRASGLRPGGPARRLSRAERPARAKFAPGALLERDRAARSLQRRSRVCLAPVSGAARERKAWMEDIVNVMLLIVLGGGGLLVALIYAISTGSARSERLQRLEEEQAELRRALKDAAARIAW